MSWRRLSGVLQASEVIKEILNIGETLSPTNCFS